MKYEVRAYFEHHDGTISSYPLDSPGLPEATPDGYAVYRNLPDGRQEWVADCGDLDNAKWVADVLEKAVDPETLTRGEPTRDQWQGGHAASCDRSYPELRYSMKCSCGKDDEKGGD